MKPNIWTDGVLPAISLLGTLTLIVVVICYGARFLTSATIDIKTIDNKDYVCYYKKSLQGCYEVGKEVSIKERAIALE